MSEDSATHQLEKLISELENSSKYITRWLESVDDSKASLHGLEMATQLTRLSASLNAGAIALVIIFVRNPPHYPESKWLILIGLASFLVGLTLSIMSLETFNVLDVEVSTINSKMRFLKAVARAYNVAVSEAIQQAHDSWRIIREAADEKDAMLAVNNFEKARASTQEEYDSLSADLKELEDVTSDKDSQLERHAERANHYANGAMKFFWLGVGAFSLIAARLVLST